MKTRNKLSNPALDITFVRRHARQLLLATASLVALSACGGEVPTDGGTSNSGSNDVQLLTGGEIFQRQCVQCHDFTAQAPFAIGGNLDRQALVDVITRTMPFMAPEDCNSECAVKVADFILSQ